MKKIFGNKFVIIGLVVVALLVAYYFYDKRWRKFSDNGNSDFLTGGHVWKLGLLMEDATTGLNVGDNIEVQIDGGSKQETTILGFEKDSHGNNFVVCNIPFTAYKRVSGQLRKA